MRAQVVVLFLFTIAVASPAGAQTVPEVTVLRDGVTQSISFLPVGITDSARRQTPEPKWSPIVFGGILAAGGGAGVAVGGGVRGDGVMGNERFGLQFDGLWSTADFCSGCSEFGVDYSGKVLAITASFLYLLKESTSGWKAHVGGGIGFIRWSSSFSSPPLGIAVINTSGTTGGIQVQGGVTKGNLMIEARAQTAAGGGMAALVGYRFGSK